MTKETVLVTGGAGFIGSRLVDRLIAEGLKVRVIDDLTSGPGSVNPRADLYRQNVADYSAIASVFTGVDRVFHLAAQPRVQLSIENPLSTHRSNVDGTLSVLEAARAAGVKKVVLASSAAVYGDQETLPYSEDLPLRPQTPYALHKQIGEQYAKLYRRLYGLPTLSLRYFNVYGPGQSADGAYALVIAKFLRLKESGQPLSITGDGSQTRDFVHLLDVVEANMQAAWSPRGDGRAINIGSGQGTSVNRLAELIGGEVTYTAGRLEPKNSRADISRAREWLDWSPQVSLEAGLAQLTPNKDHAK